MTNTENETTPISLISDFEEVVRRQTIEFEGQLSRWKFLVSFLRKHFEDMGLPEALEKANVTALGDRTSMRLDWTMTYPIHDTDPNWDVDELINYEDEYGVHLFVNVLGTGPDTDIFVTYGLHHEGDTLNRETPCTPIKKADRITPPGLWVEKLKLFIKAEPPAPVSGQTEGKRGGILSGIWQ